MYNVIDYNFLSPTNINELLFSPYDQALGMQTYERIRQQILYYEYYNGKQHVDPNTGQLVNARDLPRPAGLDYDPTRYTTNLFKVFIQRKSRWQFGGTHSVHVKPKQLDDAEKQALPDYVPSPKQKRENERSENYEKLLRKLWKENKMQEKLLKASRDRLIAGQVACKIMFNPNTGKINWIFRPDYEVIPVYSDDDFEDLLAVHFIHQRENDENKTEYYKQTFSLENGRCYIEEGIYDEALRLIRTITAKSDMGLDFIPVVLIPVSELSGESDINQEPEDMKALTDVLNQMNEDAIDSLKFEMFSMTALINAPAGTAEKVKIAPASILEITGTGATGGGDTTPSVQKIEGGFRWKEAFNDQYTRVKSALHEVTNVPNIVPQELNFGGLNSEALHVLFQSIISETEEHWLVWQDRLQELHEKTIRYLQARLNANKFAYDKTVVIAIGEDYDNEIEFRLPLPDNRKDLVALLTMETSAGFESLAGAMKRLGVDDITLKQQEIQNEKTAAMALVDPYAVGDGSEKPPENNKTESVVSDDEK